MKKEYIVPSAEVIVVAHATTILEGSWNDHADGKASSFFEDEDDYNDMSQMPKGRNLWEE